jgi:hypothetical protein
LACSLTGSLWHPDIPPPALSFLGASQLFRNADHRQELPICFQLVNYLNDQHAEELTSVTFRAYGSYRGLDDEELGPGRSIMFGSTNAKDRLGVGLQGIDTDIERDFAIDGGGGERITGLDTIYAYQELLEFQVGQYRLVRHSLV